MEVTKDTREKISRKDFEELVGIEVSNTLDQEEEAKKLMDKIISKDYKLSAADILSLSEVDRTELYYHVLDDIEVYARKHLMEHYLVIEDDGRQLVTLEEFGRIQRSIIRQYFEEHKSDLNAKLIELANKKGIDLVTTIIDDKNSLILKGLAATVVDNTKRDILKQLNKEFRID